jgi:hypothetical protein
MPGVTNQILNIDTALKVLCEKYEVGLYTYKLKSVGWFNT